MRSQSTAKLHAPKCSLPCCNTQVGYHRGYVKKNGSPTWRWKAFCEVHRTVLRFKVEEWKQQQGCENKSGYLGWFCRDPYRSLTIDHHDGDKLNTSVTNFKILCANCHNAKTKLFGDHKKKYSYTNKMFSTLFEEVQNVQKQN
jgi:5-methylcytosine-specific restriction endonuclease McrA